MQTSLVPSQANDSSLTQQSWASETTFSLPCQNKCDQTNLAIIGYRTFN